MAQHRHLRGRHHPRCLPTVSFILHLNGNDRT
jgi:hypothetical protein